MSNKKEAQSQEQIIAEFNSLRQDQKRIAVKLSELEVELREHTLVINTLKDVDPERKAYRMINSVLVERQVKDVLPSLQYNHEQVTLLLQTLNKQFEDKGVELQKYKEKYNIRIVGEKDAEKQEEKMPDSSTGVLVS